MQLLIIPTSALLIAGWTYAWLTWLFQADVRNWLLCAMPDRWKAGVTDAAIMRMDPDDVTVFLAADSDAPYFVRGVLTCERCCSAHLAGIATIVCVFALDLDPWVAPLVWATGAAISLKLRP